MFVVFVVIYFVTSFSLVHSIIFFPSSATIPSGPQFVPSETEIEVHNRHDFDLQLSLKSFSCGWLTAVLRESLIHPGEFTTMSLRATGMIERGIHNCSIALMSTIVDDSNELDEGFLQYYFVDRSIGENEYGIRPYEFSGSRSEISLQPDRFSAEISLQSPSHYALSIYEVFSESEFLDVGLNSENRDTFRVGISTPVSPGVYRSFVTVQTNYDRIIVPIIFRQLRDTFRFVGAVLDFGLLNYRGQEVSREVILEYSGTENLLIGSVFLHEESPFLVLHVLDPPRSIGHNRTVLATLTFSAQMSGTFTGNIVVATNQQLGLSQSYVLSYIANVAFENRIVHLQNAVLYFRPRTLYHASSKSSQDLILAAGTYNIPLDDETFIIEEAHLVTCQEFLSLSYSFSWIPFDSSFPRPNADSRKITSKRSVIHVHVKRDVLFEELSYSTGFSRSCWIELASNISFHKLPLHLSTGRVEVDAIQATQLEHETKIANGENGILFRDFVTGNVGLLSQLEPRDVKIILSNYNPSDEVITALFDHTYNKNELSNFRRGAIGNACLCVMGYVPIGTQSLSRCVKEMDTNNVADYSYFFANSARSPHCVCVGDEDRSNNFGMLLRGGFHTILSLMQRRLKPTPISSPLCLNLSSTERVTHYKVTTTRQEITLRLQYQPFHRGIQFECVNSFFCNIFSVGMPHINIRAAVPSSGQAFVSPRFQFDALSPTISLQTQHIGTSGVYSVFDTLVSLALKMRNDSRLFHLSMWHTALRLVDTTAHLNSHTILGNIQEHANQYFYYSNNIARFNKNNNLTDNSVFVKILVEDALKQLTQIEMDCVDSQGNIHFPRLFVELTRFNEMLKVWYVKGLRLENTGLLVSSFETTKSFTFSAPLAVLPQQILPVSYEAESPLLLGYGRTSSIYLAFVNPFEVDVQVAVVTNHSFAFMRLSQESSGAIDWNTAMGDVHSDKRIAIRPIVGENGMTESLVTAVTVFESADLIDNHHTSSNSNNNNNIGDYLIRFPTRQWTVAAHQSMVIGPIEVVVSSHNHGGMQDSTEAEFTALIYNSFSGFDTLLLRLNSSNPKIVLKSVNSVHCSTANNCERSNNIVHNWEPVIGNKSSSSVVTHIFPAKLFPTGFHSSKMLRLPFNRLQYYGRPGNKAFTFNIVLQNIGSSMLINYLAVGDIVCSGGVQQKHTFPFFDYLVKFLPILSHLGSVHINSLRVGNKYIDNSEDDICQRFPLELKHHRILELEIEVSPLNIFQTFFLRLSLRELLPDQKQNNFGFDTLFVFEDTSSAYSHINIDQSGPSKEIRSIFSLLWNLDHYSGILLLMQIVFTSATLVLVIILTLNTFFVVAKVADKRIISPVGNNNSNILESFIHQKDKLTFPFSCSRGGYATVADGGMKANAPHKADDAQKKINNRSNGVSPSKLLSVRLQHQKSTLFADLNASKSLTPLPSSQLKASTDSLATTENFCRSKKISSIDIDNSSSLIKIKGGDDKLGESLETSQKLTANKRKGKTPSPSKPIASSINIAKNAIGDIISISNNSAESLASVEITTEKTGQKKVSFIEKIESNLASQALCTRVEIGPNSLSLVSTVESIQEETLPIVDSNEDNYAKNSGDETDELLHGPPGLVQHIHSHQRHAAVNDGDNIVQRDRYAQELVVNDFTSQVESVISINVSEESAIIMENDDAVFQYQGQLLGDDSEFLFDVNPFISPQENKFLSSLPQSGLFNSNFQEFSLTRQFNIDLDFEPDYDLSGQLSLLDGEGSGIFGFEALDMFSSSPMSGQQLGSIMSFLYDTSPVENIMMQHSPLSNLHQPPTTDDSRWMGMNIVGTNNNRNVDSHNFFAEDQFFNLGDSEPLEELEI